jgi:Domain of unknown function (DUF6468)
VTNNLGTMIEGLVAILLVLTIGYCGVLNRRLKLFKADELSLKATISELVTATEIAERAIGGLKLTVAECEAGLGARLSGAERLTADLDSSMVGARELLARLTQIAAVAEPAAVVAESAAVRNDPHALAAAAHAFAERLRVKVHGLAA